MSRTAAERAAIDRDGSRCRRCARPLDEQQASLHHRKLKGRGTPVREYDLVENLVVLCGSGTTGCHSWAHHERAQSAEAGWTVSRYEPEPASVPALTLYGTRVWFHPDGTITEESARPWSLPPPPRTTSPA